MDGSDRVAAFQLSHKTEILLQTSTASLLLVREVFPPPVHRSYISRPQRAVSNTFVSSLV